MRKLLVPLMLVVLMGADRRDETVKMVAKVLPSVAIVNADGRLKGTGVAVRDDLVATASHVVGLSTTVEIVVGNDKCDGKVVFNDPNFDLALVQVTFKLKAVTLCLDPEVGEKAVAIGHPGKMVNSVATGVVSGLEREVEMSEVKLTGLIQTSACLNPGNSGGPLFNIDGELLGINILTRSNGVGFAVKAFNVKRALEVMKR